VIAPDLPRRDGGRGVRCRRWRCADADWIALRGCGRRRRFARAGCGPGLRARLRRAVSRWGFVDGRDGRVAVRRVPRRRWS